ncbi:MAG: hypothetical protein IPM79_33345 [Polyangiaceae bacterium]|nr:hypothetical protein [Polyangiaceae bacterium]
MAIACTLAEVALLVGGSAGSPELHPPALLDAIPVESKAAIIDADIGRIERSVEYLERWFSAVAAASLEDAKRLPVLRAVVDESPSRAFSMEARLVEELLPTAASAPRGCARGTTRSTRAPTSAAWRCSSRRPTRSGRARLGELRRADPKRSTRA